MRECPWFFARWLVLPLLVSLGCDDDSYRHGPGPDEGPVELHDVQTLYETDAGRYTIEIVSDEWSPAAGEVRFELRIWDLPKTGVLKLTADPAVRIDAEQEPVDIPFEPVDPHAWVLGPVELSPGVWHVPLRLTDEDGADSMELRLEVVEPDR